MAWINRRVEGGHTSNLNESVLSGCLEVNQPTEGLHPSRYNGDGTATANMLRNLPDYVAPLIKLKIFSSGFIESTDIKARCSVHIQLFTNFFCIM